ncbi:MAG: hypothetical protein H0T79_23830, partial [Deltaproteobacteria bacterium]|nr:hypothetical protein [Deltaproteobacteria bacterium]
GSGSAVAAGSGSAAPSKAGFCIVPDGTNSLTSFTADAKAAMFCVANEVYTGDAPVVTPACATLDLATGALASGTAPAAPKPELEFKQAKDGVQACKGAACVKLDVPGLTEHDGAVTPYAITPNGDGTLLTVIGNDLKGVLVLDAKTGKKKHTLKVGDGDYTCTEQAEFLGDAVYVVNSVCAGPGGKGYLFRNGKQYGTVGAVNVYGSSPFQLDGDVWAFSGFGGTDLELVDVKAAKSIRKIEIPNPEECASCDSLNGESQMATPLAKSGTKLVAISGLGVSVIDPQTGKVEKTHRFEVCPPKK